MKKILIITLLTFLANSIFAGGNPTPVEKHGQLRIDGIHMVDKEGAPVQLRGMSMFWSQWMGKYYNKSTVKWLKKDWKCTVVRPAMGIEKGGYLENPKIEKAKVEAVVKACIKEGLYVIIDFHSHEAHEHPEKAKEFFGEMAKKYGAYPNIIYEIYNEPLGGPKAWNDNIKPYADQVIAEIRKYDPDNIVVVGTPQWSQLVDAATANPIEDKNTAYTLHFYAATHKQSLRDVAQVAIDRGYCLFVTEFGTCPASGNGPLNLEETKTWFEFLDKYKISWCNWSVADKNESASVIVPGANEFGGWRQDELTESGTFIRGQIRMGNE